MNLFLIRHLPTPRNEQGLLQGTKNIEISPVSKLFQEGIKDNLVKLNTVDFDEVIVSEMIRTQQTAEQYGFNNYKIEPLINELDFGKYEGVKKALMLEEVGDNWYQNATKVTLGEPLLDFEKRIKVFLDSYKHCENVLLFSHGAVIRALIELSKEGNIDKMNLMHVENNSINCIRID